MKNNIRITLEYDGSRYDGWQKQGNTDNTIQGKLENVLFRMSGEEIEVHGSGRTDAGVHARGQVANFHINAEICPDGESAREYLNRYLPDDIAVLEVREASPRFHARYKAAGKTYCYTCYDGPVKPVFNRKYVTKLIETVDVDRMKQAAVYLEGEHDYKSFCGNPKMKKSTIRIVDKIEVRRSKGYIYFTFHGTGFLQNMVRILVGTLLEVGKGKIPPEQVKEILEAKDRQQAGPTAPAEGLCLIKVDY